MTPSTYSAFCDELSDILEKTAARVTIRQLRSLVQAGETGAAHALAQRLHAAGQLKITPQGTQLRHLGTGTEGVGTLVVGARDAPGVLAVRKAYDRDGAMFNRTLLSEKHNILRRAKDNPIFAKMYSPRIRAGKGGTPYTLNEYVAGTPVTGSPNSLLDHVEGVGSTQLTQAAGGLSGQSLGVGRNKQLLDVLGSPGNVLKPAKGRARIVDFTPTTTERVVATMNQTSPVLVKRRAQAGITQTVAPAASMQGAHEALQPVRAEVAANPTIQQRLSRMGPLMRADQTRSVFEHPLAITSTDALGTPNKIDLRRTLRGL